MWKSLVNLIVSGVFMAGAVNVANAEGVAPNSTSKTMEWQMMPGENLNSLAKLFYPKSAAMQRQFVKSAMKLNREAMPELTPEFKFDESTNIQIPSLIELSRHAMKKKPRKPVTPAADMPEKPAAMIEPEKQAPTGHGKQQDASVQQLEQRVDQRQKELDKLNERVKLLEQEAKSLQDSIKANTQPIEEAKGRQLKRVGP